MTVDAVEQAQRTLMTAAKERREEADRLERLARALGYHENGHRQYVCRHTGCRHVETAPLGIARHVRYAHPKKQKAA